VNYGTGAVGGSARSSATASHARAFVRRLPPGPTGLSYLVDPLVFMRNPVAYFAEARKQYGSVVRVPLGPTNTYLVSDPALIEHVLIHDAKSYVKDPIIRLLGREITGDGVFTTDGEMWRRQRRLNQPAFHRERLTRYAEVMSACATEYIDQLAIGQTRDLEADMSALTLNVISRTMLSVDDAASQNELSSLMRAASDRFAIDWSLVVPFVRRLPFPANRRFANVMRRLDRFVARILRERRAGGAKRDDLLDMLIEARDEAGNPLDDAQIRNQVVTMLIAGQDTTAMLLCYAFSLLTRHPDAERALLDELSSTLGGRVPQLSDLPSLKYAEAVVLETLRFTPSVWTFVREAATDTELGEYHVPRGTLVHISPPVLHRDPELFAAPDAFRPERWLDGLQKRLPRGAFVPFGAGARQCLGAAFATMEATLVLATVAPRVRLRALAAPSEFVFTFSLRPRGGLRARVESR